ncbi:MAG: hypothetical protein M1828_006529 [Chrysothrix sp. TS-e1954]|nr:MAG: hypothetical protein M1828_006529 [Chrysothrix sp. TS-e1954]
MEQQALRNKRDERILDLQVQRKKDTGVVCEDHLVQAARDGDMEMRDRGALALVDIATASSASSPACFPVHCNLCECQCSQCLTRFRRSRRESLDAMNEDGKAKLLAWLIASRDTEEEDDEGNNMEVDDVESVDEESGEQTEAVDWDDFELYSQPRSERGSTFNDKDRTESPLRVEISAEPDLPGPTQASKDATQSAAGQQNRKKSGKATHSQTPAITIVAETRWARFWSKYPTRGSIWIKTQATTLPTHHSAAPTK